MSTAALSGWIVALIVAIGGLVPLFKMPGEWRKTKAEVEVTLSSGAMALLVPALDRAKDLQAQVDTLSAENVSLRGRMSQLEAILRNNGLMPEGV